MAANIIARAFWIKLIQDDINAVKLPSQFDDPDYTETVELVPDYTDPVTCNHIGIDLIKRFLDGKATTKEIMDHAITFFSETDIDELSFVNNADIFKAEHTVFPVYSGYDPVQDDPHPNAHQHLCAMRELVFGDAYDEDVYT
jgi:hypothetical protein